MSIGANRIEEREQARFMRWCHALPVQTISAALLDFFHVPNGGKRDAFTGAQMRALGVKPGIPDLFLPHPKGAFIGLIIEMKSQDGRLSEAQKRWQAVFIAQGWHYTLARSADEARQIAANYLQLPELLGVPL